MQKLAATILDEIVAARRLRVAQAKSVTALEDLHRSIVRRADFRDFAAALSAGGLRVIAEMKKASPSAGLLRREYQCSAIAKAYARAGACALSVLTEPDYFLGSLEDLRQARSASALPVLCKDFVLGAYQVYEAVAAGADAILLIAAVLPDGLLADLVNLCQRLRVAALVEVHTAEELDFAVAARARIIGVNNRDLKSLEVSLDTSLRLRERIPAGCLAVAESGIKSVNDLKRLADAGYEAVLIGEHFMKSDDPGEALAHLLANVAA